MHTVRLADRRYELTKDDLDRLAAHARTLLKQRIHARAYIEQDDKILYDLSLQQVRTGAAHRFLEYRQHLTKGGKDTRSEVLLERDIPTVQTVDFDSLETHRHLKKAGFKTAYVIMPPLKRLMNQLKAMYIARVLQGYHEIDIPKYTTLQVFKKSGHIRLPDLAYLVARVKGSAVPRLMEQGYVHKSWSDLQSAVKCVGVATIGQCEPLWAYLERQSLSLTTPVKWYDISGYSLRNEGNAVHSLERLDTFLRIEAITLHRSETTLLETIDRHVMAMGQFLDCLNLRYRVLRVSSWLPAKGFSAIKTIDFEAWLPQKKTWLQIGNVSNNGQVFAHGFDVRVQGGGRPYSTCAGLGLTRLLYVFLCQRGLNKANWPSCLQHLDIDLSRQYLI